MPCTALSQPRRTPLGSRKSLSELAIVVARYLISKGFVHWSFAIWSLLSQIKVLVVNAIPDRMLDRGLPSNSLTSPSPVSDSLIQPLHSYHWVCSLQKFKRCRQERCFLLDITILLTFNRRCLGYVDKIMANFCWLVLRSCLPSFQVSNMKSGGKLNSACHLVIYMCFRCTRQESILYIGTRYSCLICSHFRARAGCDSQLQILLDGGEI